MPSPIHRMPALRWCLPIMAPLAAIALLAAITPAYADASAPTGAQTPAPAPVTLKVMSFNIWYGGEQVDFAQIVEAIRLAGADIVGIQEPDGFLDKLAEATGLAYADALHAWVMVRPGKVVALATL